MKKFIYAACVALIVAACPVMADTATAPAMGTDATTMMSADDCKAAMAKCADQACKDALMKNSGCKAGM